jgi:hypothetical protein
MAELDVCEGEFVSGQERVTSEPCFGDVKFMGENAQRLLDRGRIPILWRSAHHTPEYRPREIQCDVDLGPLGPLVDMRARLKIRWPERGIAVTVGEIPQDGPRLPQGFIMAVPDDRHCAIRVHLQEFPRVVAAMYVADVMALERQPQFPDAPHQRLHIG